MPLGFLMKDFTLGCCLEQKTEQLSTWPLHRQLGGSFFISSIRETPLTSYHGQHLGEDGSRRV